MNPNDTNAYKKGCATVTGIGELLDKMISQMLENIGPEADMPDASPLDLLSKSDYENMKKNLEKKYGPLCPYIDENYVALLVALAEYEDVDFDTKIKAHIAANVKRA